MMRNHGGAPVGAVTAMTRFRYSTALGAVAALIAALGLAGHGLRAAPPSIGTTVAIVDATNPAAPNQAGVDASGNLKVNCNVGCAGGSASNNADGVATSTTLGQTQAYPYVWNGATWDRLYGDKTNGAFVNVKQLPGVNLAAATTGGAAVSSTQVANNTTAIVVKGLGRDALRARGLQQRGDDRLRQALQRDVGDVRLRHTGAARHDPGQHLGRRRDLAVRQRRRLLDRDHDVHHDRLRRQRHDRAGSERLHRQRALQMSGGMKLFTAALAAVVLWGGIAAAQLLTLGAGSGGAGSSCADPNWSTVVLLVGNDNAANGTTTFADQSNGAHSMSKGGSGTLQYSNSTAPSGLTTSINFGGSAWILTADSADWSFGGGDFTLEAWVSFTSSVNNQGFVSNWSALANPTNEWTLDVASATERLVTASSGSQQNVTSSWTPTAGTWYHVAGSRASGTGRIFINGTLQNSATISGALNGGQGNNTVLGGISQGTGTPVDLLAGNLASVRVTKGVARYTGNFTLPSLPLPHC
jgi:hypothetical protein